MVSKTGIQMVDPVTGEDRGEDMKVLEDAGIAFDPMSQHLDLSTAEKRRTTALMLAIQGYRELIIKEADYLREADSIARRDGTTIKPATINAMVDAAIQFDHFIGGGYEHLKPASPEKTEPAKPADGGDR